MKRLTQGLLLATLFSVTSSVNVVAQDKRVVAAPRQARSNSPSLNEGLRSDERSLRGIFVREPDGGEDGGLIQKKGVVRSSDMLAQSGRSGRGSSRSSQNNPSQRGDGQRDQRGSGFRDSDRRDDSRREQRDSGRRDDGRRSQFGINIGPGGVQVFRTDPGNGRGVFGPSRGGFNGGSYFDRGRGSYSGNPLNWYRDRYLNRGWGIGINTRPSYVYPSNPVIVTEPQAVQPSSPRQPAESPIPTKEQLAEMPEFELRGLLLYAADRLDEQLDGLSTGGGWRSYLKVDDLKRIVPAPSQAPPAPGTSAEPQPNTDPLAEVSVRRQLADILPTFDSVKQNGDYRQINQLWGFKTTHLVLQEMLIPRIERLRKQLPLSTALLKQDLQKIETGPGWIRHLKLADAERIAATPAKDISAADRKQLQELVSVFDSAAAEISYKTISELPGFQWTHYVARSYLDEFKRLAPAAPPAPPAKP